MPCRLNNRYNHVNLTHLKRGLTSDNMNFRPGDDPVPERCEFEPLRGRVGRVWPERGAGSGPSLIPSAQACYSPGRSALPAYCLQIAIAGQLNILPENSGSAAVTVHRLARFAGKCS
jgi:hypothetical protein